MIGKDIVERPVSRVRGGRLSQENDRLAVEEPLEIRLGYHSTGGARRWKSISVTMRTPGADVDLALGFLYAEGVLDGFGAVDRIKHTGPSGDKRESRNIVTVHLKVGVAFDAERLERHFYTTSSCGVCGKTSLEALEISGCPTLLESRPRLRSDLIHTLPETLRATQSVFDQTGGLHAAALFDAEGGLLRVREDVGRHNALDKLIGSYVLEEALPLSESVVLVSGRVSFELVQKALRAGVPALAAVGAPSSLAAELAEEFGMTLFGFVRGGRYNVYCGAERLVSTTTDDGRPTTRVEAITPSDQNV